MSLMLVPAIDGISGAPTTFDGPDDAGSVRLPIDKLTLIGNEILDGGGQFGFDIGSREAGYPLSA